MKQHLNKILLGAALLAVLLSLRAVHQVSLLKSERVEGSLSGSQTLGVTYGLYCGEAECITGTPMTATSTPRVAADGVTHYYVEELNAFNLGKIDEVLTGTTSVIVSTGGADMLDINATQVGSTTDFYLTWDPEFSNDGIGFYSGTLFSDQSDFHTKVGTSTYDNEGFTLEGTTTQNIQINTLGSRFVRVNFGAKGSIGTATGTLHVEIVKRNNN